MICPIGRLNTRARQHKNPATRIAAGQNGMGKKRGATRRFFHPDYDRWYRNRTGSARKTRVRGLRENPFTASGESHSAPKQTLQDIY